ncbi:hypothetical protein IAT38_000198 [Cryptococcus sp. DSM 104549]
MPIQIPPILLPLPQNQNIPVLSQITSGPGPWAIPSPAPVGVISELKWLAFHHLSAGRVAESEAAEDLAIAVSLDCALITHNPVPAPGPNAPGPDTGLAALLNSAQLLNTMGTSIESMSPEVEDLSMRQDELKQEVDHLTRRMETSSARSRNRALGFVRADLGPVPNHDGEVHPPGLSNVNLRTKEDIAKLSLKQTKAWLRHLEFDVAPLEANGAIKEQFSDALWLMLGGPGLRRW